MKLCDTCGQPATKKIITNAVPMEKMPESSKQQVHGYTCDKHHGASLQMAGRRNIEVVTLMLTDEERGE